MSVSEDIAAQKTGMEFLEHYGVKGQKWGIRRRRIAKQQKRIDRLRRVEVGKGSKTDKFIAGYAQVPLQNLILGKGLKGGAARTLNKTRDTKTKILNGERKTQDLLNRALGVNVRDLDFSKMK
jgi:hypothetical protein